MQICDQRVCIFICLFFVYLLACISQKVQSKFQLFLYLLPVAWLRRSVLLWWKWDTLCNFGFVDDVIFSYNWQNRQESKTTRMFCVQFARWRHREWSMLSPTATCLALEPLRVIAIYCNFVRNTNAITIPRNVCAFQLLNDKDLSCSVPSLKIAKNRFYFALCTPAYKYMYLSQWPTHYCLVFMNVAVAFMVWNHIK